jgi:hypothetical protein
MLGSYVPSVRKKRIDPLTSPSKLVKLRLAAAAVHAELTGQMRFNMRAPDYVAALTKAATDLASIVEIYRRATGRMLRLSQAELREGAFEDGGNLFRMHSGEVHRALFVNRVDALKGIEVLRSTGVVFADATAALAPKKTDG